LNHKLKFNDLCDFIGEKNLELRILCYPSDGNDKSSVKSRKKKKRNHLNADESREAINSEKKSPNTRQSFINSEDSSKSSLEIKSDGLNSKDSLPKSTAITSANQQSAVTNRAEEADNKNSRSSFIPDKTVPPSNLTLINIPSDVTPSRTSQSIKEDSTRKNPWANSGHDTDSSGTDDDTRQKDVNSTPIALSPSAGHSISSSPSPVNSFNANISVSSTLSGYSAFSQSTQQLPSLDDLKVENTSSLTSPIRKRKISSDSNMILKQLGISSNRNGHDSSSSDSEDASSDDD
jgi:hypothetical protein